MKSAPLFILKKRKKKIARLKERRKIVGHANEGVAREQPFSFRLSAALQSKPPHYNTRNMVVARATLVDTRRAAIMPFRIATREQGPPSSSSSSSSLSFFLRDIVIDLCWILRDQTQQRSFERCFEKISLKFPFVESLQLIQYKSTKI